MVDTSTNAMVVIRAAAGAGPTQSESAPSPASPATILDHPRIVTPPNSMPPAPAAAPKPAGSAAPRQVATAAPIPTASAAPPVSDLLKQPNLPASPYHVPPPIQPVGAATATAASASTAAVPAATITLPAAGATPPPVADLLAAFKPPEQSSPYHNAPTIQVNNSTFQHSTLMIAASDAAAHASIHYDRDNKTPLPSSPSATKPAAMAGEDGADKSGQKRSLSPVPTQQQGVAPGSGNPNSKKKQHSSSLASASRAGGDSTARQLTFAAADTKHSGATPHGHSNPNAAAHGASIPAPPISDAKALRWVRMRQLQPDAKMEGGRFADELRDCQLPPHHEYWTDPPAMSPISFLQEQCGLKGWRMSFMPGNNEKRTQIVAAMSPDCIERWFNWDVANPCPFNPIYCTARQGSGQVGPMIERARTFTGTRTTLTARRTVSISSPAAPLRVTQNPFGLLADMSDGSDEPQQSAIPPAPISIALQPVVQFVCPKETEQNALRPCRGGSIPTVGRLIGAFSNRFSPRDECTVVLGTKRVIKVTEQGALRSVAYSAINELTGGTLSKSCFPASVRIRRIINPPVWLKDKQSFTAYTELVIEWKSAPPSTKVWDTPPRAAAASAAIHPPPNDRQPSQSSSHVIKYGPADPTPPDAELRSPDDVPFYGEPPIKWLVCHPASNGIHSHPAAKEVVRILSGQSIGGIPTATHPPVRWLAGTVRNIQPDFDPNSILKDLQSAAPDAVIGFLQTQSGTLKDRGCWAAAPSALGALVQISERHGIRFNTQPSSSVCVNCGAIGHSERTCTRQKKCLRCTRSDCPATRTPFPRCPNSMMCTVCEKEHSVRTCLQVGQSERITRNNFDRIENKFTAGLAPARQKRKPSSNRSDPHLPTPTPARASMPGGGATRPTRAQWGGQSPLALNSHASPPAVPAMAARSNVDQDQLSEFEDFRRQVEEAEAHARSLREQYERMLQPPLQTEMDLLRERMAAAKREAERYAQPPTTHDVPVPHSSVHQPAASNDQHRRNQEEWQYPKTRLRRTRASSPGPQQMQRPVPGQARSQSAPAAPLRHHHQQHQPALQQPFLATVQNGVDVNEIFAKFVSWLQTNPAAAGVFSIPSLPPVAGNHNVHVRQ